MSFTPRSAVLFFVSLWLGGAAVAVDYRVTLPSSDVPRRGQVVSITLPADAPRVAVLDAEGISLPLQIEDDHSATLIVPEQKAGETLRFVLRSGDAKGNPNSAAGVESRREKGVVRVTAAGRPVFEFRIDRDALPRPDIKPEFKRAGYLHPVFSPSGKVVTDDYPSNHVHHHGIWTPWTKTRFQGRSPDFWNMGTKTAREDFVALDGTWNGRVQGGFEAKLEMVDLSAPKPVVALHETWRVVAYAVPQPAGMAPVQMFDLVVTQTCATNDPVELPEYHYGGFGLRGSTEWNGKGDAALFLTSEGITDRIAGNNTRGRWCYLGGKLAGTVAGTAVLGHPENFRAPQSLRLHPDMPYFSYVPQQLGGFSIEPGKPYVARFRFVVTDGAPDRAFFDAFWNGYAAPAAAIVEPVR